MPLAEVSDEAFNRAFDSNTPATFFFLREVAQCVRAGGRVIIIGSPTTMHPAAGFSAYAASKAPSIVLLPIKAAELAPRGITVNGRGPDRRRVFRSLVA
ncbi:SDR family NAD(P)-dependent oxidoreductase [Caballeronia sp. 15715]|uniref:SDR family NAD(P)-dependent oxidoreductase n=1 Tax=Caballeronia sp. 15715 TaxID=3391030 RepID=UPI0039E3EA5C